MKKFVINTLVGVTSVKLEEYIDVKEIGTVYIEAEAYREALTTWREMLDDCLSIFITESTWKRAHLNQYTLPEFHATMKIAAYTHVSFGNKPWKRCRLTLWVDITEVDNGTN